VVFSELGDFPDSAVGVFAESEELTVSFPAESLEVASLVTESPPDSLLPFERA
jgi:hypothetical protein